MRRKVIKRKTIPSGSIVAEGFGVVHYFDAYSICKRSNRDAQQMALDLMQTPKWVTWLFKLRSAMVKPFGLRTGNIDGVQVAAFSPIYSLENEFVVGENDTHLNFRVAILKEKGSDALSVITIVRFNNPFGKCYFFFIKPFHKLIVRALLKRYLTKKN